MELSLGDKFFTIDTGGDMMLRLYENSGSETFRAANGETVSGFVLATYIINFKIMREACESQHSEAIYSGPFQDGAQNRMDIKKGTVKSLELVFRILHKLLTPELMDIRYITVNEVWEAIQVSIDWKIESHAFELMKEWFADYLKHNGSTIMSLPLVNFKGADLRELLFPCWKLDNADAFRFLSRKFAYETPDHLVESNPTFHGHLHMPIQVLGAINAAKGSLRTKLLQSLFDPVSDFLLQTCECKEKALFAYNMGLSKTGIWPLESSHKNSTQQILDSPGFVSFVCDIPENACPSCYNKLQLNFIAGIRRRIQELFEGLCLDCMNRSQTAKTSDMDAEYWNQDREKAWSGRCRFTHSQNTWYYSFMGRRELMKKFQQKEKERKKALAGMRPSYA